MLTDRSRSREVALQLLFVREHNAQLQREQIERFVEKRLREEKLRPFCLELYDGVVQHLADIDQRLTDSADNWRLVRMATVDRNALRIGAFELLHRPATPPSVAFDEAIELARRYGTADSPAFVNGVLDRLRKGIAPLEPSEPSTQNARSSIESQDSPATSKGEPSC